MTNTMNEVFAQCKSFDPAMFRDIYRDAYGCRPRMSFEGMTAEQLDELFDSTYAMALIEMDRADKEAAENFEAFKARLEGMVTDFTISIQDAFRWLLQAENLAADYEHYGISVVNHHFGMECQSKYDQMILDLIK